MEKINLEKTNMNSEENKIPAVMLQDKVEREFIYGWETAGDAASSIWSSIHRNIVEGDLVFAYKNTSRDKKYYQIIIVANRDDSCALNGKYSVYITEENYSVNYPSVPKQYLQVEVVESMEQNDVDENIIETFKQIVEDF